MAMTLTFITCKFMPITMSKSKWKMKRTEWSVSQHLATSNTKAGWGPRGANISDPFKTLHANAPFDPLSTKKFSPFLHASSLLI